MVPMTRQSGWICRLWTSGTEEKCFCKIVSISTLKSVFEWRKNAKNWVRIVYLRCLRYMGVFTCITLHGYAWSDISTTLVKPGLILFLYYEWFLLDEVMCHRGRACPYRWRIIVCLITCIEALRLISLLDLCLIKL
jgi:hypothetical protein